MARQLQIIKLSDKVWKHIDSITGAYILTKFYAKEDDSKFLIVEVYGSRRYEYAIEDISVFNIGGSAETFTNFDDLFLRLEVLKYPAFYVDGEFVFNPSAYDLSEFQNTETDRFAKLSDITGGGATTFLDLTDTPSAYTGQANKIVKVNAGETGLDFTDEAGSAIDLTQFPNTYEYGVSSSGFVQLGAYTALTMTGTQSNANANTDSSIRLRKILSSAIAGNSATAYQGSHYFISANQGFYFDTRVDEIDSGTVSDSRCFYGLAGTSLIGNIEPGSYSLGMLGLGHESTDTYFNILYKGIGLTAIDKISLGAGFPKNSNHKYAIRFWRFPNTTLIYYSIRNLSLSNLFVTGSFDFTADVPALTPNFFRNNNTTAIAVGYGINRILTQTSDEYV